MNNSVKDKLKLCGIRKSFGAEEVLKGVDLTFREGEVHALLGPNGAGKSTLLGCLSGAIYASQGAIEVGGVPHRGFTPSGAFQAGIATIYQHFQLIEDLSVSDNIFLGTELVVGGQTDYASQTARSNEILSRIGSSMNPTQLVANLSVGEQQLVEIARALRHEPSILILDEPTAALSDNEVTQLLALVKRLAHEGRMTIIFVTHILREVLRVADKISVLRDGELLWTRNREDVEIADLIEAISPQTQKNSIDERTMSASRVVLNIDNYSSAFTGPLSLSVADGEIIGVFGLLGSGRTDLLESIAGVRQGATGSFQLEGKEIQPRSPSDALRAGIAFVASDRKANGVYAEMGAEENLLIPHYSVISRPMRNRRKERALFFEMADQLGLTPRDPLREAGDLSGGNAQKLMVGRWTSEIQGLKLLLLDEPTQGIDVGARQDLYNLLRDFAAQESRVIIFASSDPEEIIALADRVVVVAGGKVVAIESSQVGEVEILRLAHS